MSGWPMIDPGRMVHWVRILRQQPVVDDSGTSVQWVPFVDTWAAIDPVSGTDIVRSGQDTAQMLLTVTMRWQTGIATNMRVQSLNGTYVIRAVENPGERNVILKLLCLALGGNQ